GITEAQAADLAALQLDPKEELDFSVFMVLVPFSDLASTYLNARPKLLEGARYTLEELFPILESTDAKSEKLRKAIGDRPDLPSLAMAWTLDPRYVPF